ncbi:hypothetical protein [Aureimonas altamirensis]|uniref:hypothetical protein n=1 Tax=Aureimonas altamirensis TaxID=370622 RepID=UPI00255357C1|nr:hypothetical protein [Aureimonas altamirensis]
MSSTVVDLPAGVDKDDPYRLAPDAVMEPPVGWRHSLRHLGPGLILSASIVGSGELIATTTLGAQAGFAQPCRWNSRGGPFPPGSRP